MSQTVVGIFDSENEAQQAVNNLVNQGFNREDVDIVSRNATQNASDSNKEDDSFGSSISNFFSSLFGSDDDRTSRYSEVAKRGCTVTVHARSEAESERAADILDEYGAVNVDERASQYGSSSNFDNLSSGSDYDRSNETINRSIPIIEENLEVGKREVESGGARIRSSIIEKPVEEHVRLRNERVSVERNPVNRQATSEDFDNFEEGTIEMRERREVPVVNKEAWVKEEVSLNKEVEENDETIRDTVRSTEIDVENLTEEQRRHRNSDSYNRTDDWDDDSSLNRDRRDL